MIDKRLLFCVGSLLKVYERVQVSNDKKLSTPSVAAPPHDPRES